ncbi:MAG: glycogen synthase GlgA [Pseudomonadota bacterium]
MAINSLQIASELYPLVKTGGLADVIGALPPALNRLGAPARILIPGYPGVMAAAGAMSAIAEWPNLFGGGPARVLEGTLEGVGAGAYVLDVPGFYGRPGTPYLDADGRDWDDNARRFAALGWTGAELARGLDPKWRPDVVHCHDWQSGLTPAYLAFDSAPRPKTAVAIHNLAYQGLFPADTFAWLGLPSASFSPSGLEFYGQVSFLKAGLVTADRITTVSRTYSHEIQTVEHGCGLDGLLQSRSGVLSGIVNGADYDVWNPANDHRLPKPYGPDTLERKAAAKEALQKKLGLEVSAKAPLFGVVSRLTWHKGLDLLLGALPVLLQRDGQLALLGTGEQGLETGFREAASSAPSQVGAVLGYDEELAHLIIAGSDVVLVPSRAEPCGLTQIYAMKYGSLPLVRNTGGLADTVVNADAKAVAAGTATGFNFNLATIDALAGTLGWVCDQWQDQAQWQAIQQTAMGMDFSWDRAAKDYLALYQTLTS